MTIVFDAKPGKDRSMRDFIHRVGFATARATLLTVGYLPPAVFLVLALPMLAGSAS